MSWTICWEAGYPDTCHRVRFSETERLIVGNAFRDSNSLHGANDEEWKGWKAIEPASHPFPFLLEIPSGFPHSHRFDEGIDVSKQLQKQADWL